MEFILKDRNGVVLHKGMTPSQDKPDVIHWQGEYYAWEEENVYVQATVYYVRASGLSKPSVST